VTLAVSTVSLLLGSSRLAGPGGTLTRLRGTLARHDRAIATVLGLLIGAFFVLDGVRGL